MEAGQTPLDIVGVRVELPSNQPVVVLRGAAEGMEKMHVAIMVGTFEANAVAMGLEKKPPPRPMTHDLLLDTLNTLSQGVESVEIGLLDASTYFGSIRLRDGRFLDARASDAIAIAVRAQCPVTMETETLRAVAVNPRFKSPGAAGQSEGSTTGSPEPAEGTDRGPISEAEIEEFQKFLDDADPEDFGTS